MSKSLKRITINPEICQGQPIIRNLRITVSFVLKLMSSGMTPKEILTSYPELEQDDLNEAIEYASWLASDYHRPFYISELANV